MKAFTDQLATFWSELEPGNRLQLVGALVVTVLVLIGVGIWSASPNWVPVTDVLGEREAREAAFALREEKIDFQRDEQDRIVVDRTNEAAALAALKAVGVHKAMIDASNLPPGTGPKVTDWALLRQREGDIARMIAEQDGIAGAMVNIVPERDDPIVLSEAEPARAAVVLSTLPGHVVGPQQVRSIVNTVVGSVDSLLADRVMVSDDTGRLLTRDFGGGDD